MTVSSDFMIDRRRLRRKLGFWRLLAIAAIVAAAVAVAAQSVGPVTPSKFTPHIARISIESIIVGEKETIDLINSLVESQARAVLVEIDSPGGTTTGAEKIYDELRRLAAKKPVVAVVGAMAASGGYIAALASDRIFVRGNSLVGSIGVLFQFPNFSKALDTVGVKVEEVKSSPLKASPNGFEPTSEAARAALASLVADSFVWFKDLVKTRRKLDDAELAKVADGRIFTGRQGLPLKLADEIGGDREAVAWLASARGLDKKLPIRDWKKKQKLDGFSFFESSAGALRFVGLDALGEIFAALARHNEGARLDGLVAIWQGSQTLRP
jgi:protease IV